MRLAAAKLANARNAYILTARGTEQHATGTATVGGWINLALSLGLPGRAGSGYGCLTGQGNGQGGREHGQKADQLPGYRKLDDPAAREYVAGVWGVDPDSLPGPGRSASELLEALGQEDGPKALMVFGSNVVVSAPRSQRVQDRLSELDFLVVADFVLSETAALADVVLPVTQWAEEDGTLTNLEGRVLLRRKAIDAPAGRPVRPGRPARTRATGWASRKTGSRPTPRRCSRSCGSRPRAASPTTPASATTGCAPVRPCTGRCPEDDHPGTPRMFLESFAHPDGRARFVPVEHTGPAELPDDEFPLQATTGRVLQHYQSGAQTRLIGELKDVVPEAFVEVHPDTAKRAGLEEGDPARIQSRRGETRRAGPVRPVAPARPRLPAVPLPR